MSTEDPQPLLPFEAATERPSFPPPELFRLPPPRPKFQHPYGRHLVFFGLTFLTTTFAPAFTLLYIGANPLQALTWNVFLGGLWYSLPLLTILSAHEFGHYFACRYHRVDCTLPYFLPAPLPLTGTLGAVIRIREAFPSKRALFDIGVAGPIAGFVMLVPFLIWGMLLSNVTVMPPDGSVIYFGEPLFWKLLERIHFGVLENGADVALHPMGFAAWWGMLATAVNLLPFGQLDGGHLMYAALGRRAAWFSAITLGIIVLLTLRSSSWVAMAVMMTVMAFWFGFRHPRIIDEHEPLDRSRRVVAVIALVIFVLCFTPVPIEILGD